MRDDQRTFGAKASGRRVVRPEDFLKFEREVIAGREFTDRKVIGFSALDCRFERCSFDRLQAEDVTFGAGAVPSVYVECSFNGARLRAPSPGIGRFERCAFKDVRLRDLIAFDLEFVDCEFSGRAEKCVFYGATRESRREMLGRNRNEFYGNDLSALELRDVSFRTGIDLRMQRLPSGSSYVYVEHAQVAIARTRAVVSGWDDDQRRTAALAILRRLERTVQDGQEQLLLEARTGRSAVRRDVLDLLVASETPR